MMSQSLITLVFAKSVINPKLGPSENTKVSVLTPEGKSKTKRSRKKDQNKTKVYTFQRRMWEGAKNMAEMEVAETEPERERGRRSHPSNDVS